MNKLIIDAIGESTSVGYYNYLPHPNDSEACIPLMVKNAVEATGISCEVHNKAVHATSVDWHLGRKDGDELIWEVDLLDSPSGIPYELAKSNSNVVMINTILNDAVGGTPSSYYPDFRELVDNCNRTGKIVYIMMPNTIPLSPDKNDVISMAYLIQAVASELDVMLVNDKPLDVAMDDMYHPAPGPLGYRALGRDIINTMTNDAQNIINKVSVVQFYVAAVNRTPESLGLNYWTEMIRIYGKDTVAQAMLDIANPNMSNDEFIDLMYLNLMGRDPDSNGRTYWQGRLDNNVSRGIVMNEIISCVEGQPLFQNKTSVAMAYGVVYKNTEVAVENNLELLGVTDDFDTVYTATEGF